MLKSARVLSVAAIAVASVFVGVAQPAGASSAARFTVRSVTRVAAAPNTNLSGKAATAKFAPAKLTAHVFPAQSDCADATVNTSFTITNATKNSYKITFQGKVAFTQPKNTIEDICFSGPKGTVTLGIKGSTKVLTVKLTTK